MSETASGEKSMVVALVLSFFVWGLGQIYQGRTKLGVIWLVAYVISVALSFLTVGLFGIVAVVLWLVNLYDVYATLIEL
jgi:TM2 domain-containing membrane protein YozV